MSIPLIVDANSYQYPAQGDKANTGWGGQATSWASAVTAALTKLGLGGTLSPIANAVINIDSTSKGILIPRMTTAQRDAITSPTNSLLIFNTTLKVVQYYDLSVSTWISIGARLPDNAIFSGTLQVNGNITGLGALTLSGALQALTGNFTDTTDAVDVDTAPLKTLGGMAVKKKLFVGGQSLSSDGTVSLPGQSFASEPASGLYKIATNKFGIAISGSRIGEFGSGYGGFTGNVIQVQSATKTDTTTFSTSFGDISGLSVSITPRYSTSKILIMAHISAGKGADIYMFFKLLRGSTDICIGDAASNRTRSTIAPMISSATSYNITQFIVPIVFLDSPNTTSTTTYKIQGMVDVNTGYINRSAADGDSAAYGRSTSTILAMEIQQ